METKEMYNVVERLYYRIKEIRNFIINNRPNLVGLNAYALFISIYDDMKYLAENGFFKSDARSSSLRSFIKIDILKSRNHELELDIYLGNTKYEITSEDIYTDGGKSIYTFKITNESRQDDVIPEIDRRRKYLVKIILNMYDRLDKYMKENSDRIEKQNTIDTGLDISLEDQIKELSKESTYVCKSIESYINESSYFYNSNTLYAKMKNEYLDLICNVISPNYELRQYLIKNSEKIADDISIICSNYDIQMSINLKYIRFKNSQIEFTLSDGSIKYIEIDDMDKSDISIVKASLIILKLYIKKFINEAKEENKLLKEIMNL